jgi:hypothetical protein
LARITRKYGGTTVLMSNFVKIRAVEVELFHTVGRRFRPDINDEIKSLSTIFGHCLDIYIYICGPGSSVSIATDYGLDGPGIESR